MAAFSNIFPTTGCSSVLLPRSFELPSSKWIQHSFILFMIALVVSSFSGWTVWHAADSIVLGTAGYQTVLLRGTVFIVPGTESRMVMCWPALRKSKDEKMCSFQAGATKPSMHTYKSQYFFYNPFYNGMKIRKWMCQYSFLPSLNSRYLYWLLSDCVL